MAKSTDPVEVARRKRDADFVAFRHETERFARRIAQFVFSGDVTKNGHDPQEAVDAAYAQFYAKNFDQTIPPEKKRAMLRKIVEARSLDFVKRSKPTSEYPEGDHHPRLGNLDPNFDRVDDIDEAARDAGEIQGILARLKPNQREALVRRVLHGETSKEIAAALGVGERRVNQLLDEATKRLKRRLQAKVTDAGDRVELDDADNLGDDEKEGGK